MASYKITEDAYTDLDRIWRQGAKKWGVVKADEYYSAFYDRFEQLAQQPFLYQAVDHVRQGYRASVCGVDTIYYRIVGDAIEIINILGRQDRGEWL